MILLSISSNSWTPRSIKEITNIHVLTKRGMRMIFIPRKWKRKSETLPGGSYKVVAQKM